MKTKLLGLALFIFFTLGLNVSFADTIKGIYVTQTSLENSATIKALIHGAKAAGIDTMIVDLDRPNKTYEKNIRLVKDSGLQYVARIVMFPGGGKPEQIHNEANWQKQYARVKAAVDYGASQIQLDYIRYDTHRGASSQHAKDIHKIISWYKQKLAPQNIPLQIDVFGIASFGEEKHIGHNIKLFSNTVDVLCPMVYPSHYVPFRQHFSTPYQTVYDSLTSIKEQFNNQMPVKLVPYIELSNYHYPLSRAKKMAYIQAQLKAVKDAGADGWYAWSPNNQYGVLFEVLKANKKTDEPKELGMKKN